MEFKPNKLRPQDVDDLEDWQVLVAVCHYGPKMGDCIKLDYGYELKHEFHRDIIYCDGHSLDGDVDIEEPMEALEGYAGISWVDMAKEHLKKALVDYYGEDEGGGERDIE